MKWLCSFVYIAACNHTRNCLTNDSKCWSTVTCVFECFVYLLTAHIETPNVHGNQGHVKNSKWCHHCNKQVINGLAACTLTFFLLSLQKLLERWKNLHKVLIQHFFFTKYICLSKILWKKVLRLIKISALDQI